MSLRMPDIQSPHIYTSQDVVVSVENPGVRNFLEKSNLNLVIASLVFKLGHERHRPQSAELERSFNNAANTYIHELLFKYFQTPTGSEILLDSLSHSYSDKEHPVIRALILVMKDFREKGNPDLVDDGKTEDIIAIEEILIQKAETRFEPIRLPALMQIRS